MGGFGWWGHTVAWTVRGGHDGSETTQTRWNPSARPMLTVRRVVWCPGSGDTFSFLFAVPGLPSRAGGGEGAAGGAAVSMGYRKPPGGGRGMCGGLPPTRWSPPPFCTAAMPADPCGIPRTLPQPSTVAARAPTRFRRKKNRPGQGPRGRGPGGSGPADPYPKDGGGGLGPPYLIRLTTFFHFATENILNACEKNIPKKRLKNQGGSKFGRRNSEKR